MKVRIAAAQMRIVPHDMQANAKKIEKFFRRAARRKCQFLCLPEECWAGLHYKEKHENEVAHFVKETTARLTKKYGLYCIAGTVAETIDGHKYNVCYVFDPDGHNIGHYAKRHPVPSAEHDRTPGPSHTVIDTKYGKIGIQICRDILYPETTHVTANMGAKIIFSPAFWSSFSTEYASSLKYHHNDELQMIKYLVPARALENEVIMVFCNAAGKYKTPERRDVLLGYTQICQPFVGPTKIFKHHRQGLMVQTVDTEWVDAMRSMWRIRGN